MAGKSAYWERPQRYELAVREAFYWAERLENGISFRDMGVEPTPGIDAALSGYWRGRNRADNEGNKATGKTEEQQYQEKLRQRYTSE